MKKAKNSKKKSAPRKKIARKPAARAKASKSASRPAPARAPKAAAKPASVPAAAAQADGDSAAHALPWRAALKGEAFLGVVDDYFAHLDVAALKLEAPLAVGDTIHVRGHTTDLTQPVESLQIQHLAVTQGQKGDAVGVKVTDKCRKGDYVYKKAG